MINDRDVIVSSENRNVENNTDHDEEESFKIQELQDLIMKGKTCKNMVSISKIEEFY